MNAGPALTSINCKIHDCGICCHGDMNRIHLSTFECPYHLFSVDDLMYYHLSNFIIILGNCDKNISINNENNKFTKTLHGKQVIKWKNHVGNAW